MDVTPGARNWSKNRRTYMLLHQAKDFPSQEYYAIMIYIYCRTELFKAMSLPLSEAFAILLAKVFGDIARSLADILFLTHLLCFAQGSWAHAISA